MNHIEVFFYFICFSIIVGSAFAMMWSNIRSINIEMNTPITSHPEKPDTGKEVLYVDVSKMTSKQFKEQVKRLEKLYEEN